jgi:hypothetical protein
LTREVYQAVDRVRVSYQDTLARKHAYDISMLEDTMLKHRDNLELSQDEALLAAFAGNVQAAVTQFAYMAFEWGLGKAHNDLIEAQQRGVYLDPTDPDIQNDFDQAIQGEVVFWATKLQNKWLEGLNQRSSDQAHTYMQHNAQLYGVYHQMIQTQGSALGQAHQFNKQYAEMALHASQQAQQGVYWMQQQATQNAYWLQQGVQGMYSHGVNVMNAALQTQKQIEEQLKQNSPEEQEKREARRERRKILTRGIVTLVIIAAILASFPLGYLFLTRMVLP